VRAEVLLRQAILADQSNPAPYAELATILRTRRQTDEARKLLESARLRVNPLDTPSLLSTALALLSLQEKTTAELPDILASDKDAASLFSAIYIALRKEDLSTATTLLQTAQEQIPPELFSSLLNDPALSHFSLRPQPNGPSSVQSTSP
jgi:Flp pilus assembly protein TadD